MQHSTHASVAVRTLITMAAFLGGVLASGSPPAGQVPDEVAAAGQAVVTEVRFEGLTRTSATYTQSVVRAKPGDPYDPAAAKADVSRLLSTGKFSAATYRTDQVEGGVVLTFVIKERQLISGVGFSGNSKFDDRKLRREVPLKPGDPVDAFRAIEGADAIAQLYRDAGYGQVQVAHDKELLRRTGDLLYNIVEGPRIRVRHIHFEGNEHFTSRKLKKQVTTATYFWIFRDGKFDEETVASDAVAIQQFLHSKGRLDARVSYTLDFTDDQQGLDVTFVIVEGTEYRIEFVDFAGNTVFGDDELRALMFQQAGGVVLPERLAQDARAIRTHYAEVGYIYARVRPVRVFSETPALVLVTMGVTEGEPYRVGRIVVRGNEQTQDKVVRRTFDLYPGDLFNMSKVTQAESALRTSRIFTRASITPVGDQPGVRDVMINVEEAAKAGDFVFGFGVTSNSGLVGSIVLDFKNFDLFDTPRTFSDFLKLRSFRGAGQRLRIEAQPGTELTRFRIDFTEPYLFDKPTRFDFSGYFFERGREVYDERRTGANVSFGKRIKWAPLEDWYGEVAFRAENVRVADLDLFAPRDVRDDEGAHGITSIKGSLVRDRTDNRFMPTRGDRWRFSYEQFGAFGGEEFFGKLTGGYARHFTLRTDVEDRKSVLSLRGNVGFIIGDAPVFERFYAGGIGSIRGFKFRGVSPRQGLESDVVGGEFLLLTTAEYAFPLYGDVLRGVFFADMGTVEPEFSVSNWRATVGFGVRLHVDFFGPIPLEFDFAVPVVSEADDEEQVFSFYIGMTF